ncbi:MAG: hypothetical protein KZQ64_06670 [gamma proteobacterium symbiont of Bathyaustriella thionipta]|nr:hypothetical protein [gamma proteobacterium symbiont of Bathyaustriella thionipta]MCU7950881.1 hypothetical protein [gamma proteobacterium symbiont of Bathyaustriella thionipta]MCU7953056.1 hypothetical protein [gamma proteobacterium symbiont of Bathyaustriella thionipta]MCU7957412.1 hypothetical protein [gamma proteobacterium symbiont of Bathyaustriella thionipta]MCU7967961.1 hypothetical protein [gamma proteobacterium symbiont of Bathyaustriella thionipta]
MQIQQADNSLTFTDKPNKVALSSTTDFARQLDKHTFVSQKTDTLSTHEGPLEQPQNIKLGTLSEKNTTVAQLLLANPQLKADTWSIIHHSINKNKAFNQIPVGKEIFYNQQTREISWSEQANKTKLINPVASSGTEGSVDTHKLVLGQLNSNNPTVSNLLSQNKELKAQRWNIIHDAVNRNKAFTKIPYGSTVYFDSKTRELSWDTTNNSGNKQSPVSDNNLILSKKLDDAVKPFMGTDYKDIDCYTLVVNGLKNMGVRYQGEDSLSVSA